MQQAVASAGYPGQPGQPPYTKAHVNKSTRTSSATPLSKLRLKTDSLAYSLVAAAQTTAAVLEGSALPQALSRIFAAGQVAPAQRGAIQDISYRTMRQLGRTQHLIAAMTDQPLQPPLLHALLCCALALIVDEDEARHPYPAFTVVDQAVTAASADPAIAKAKNLVNALLRRFLRERQQLLAEAMHDPVAQWNYPRWWIDTCRQAYPDRWQNILEAGNALPPLTLRINQRRTSPQQYLTLLHEQGIAADQVGPVAIRLERPLPVWQIPGFADGLVSVQDSAAQMAADLLDLQPGMRVLDACAAPGGKTCHLLEQTDLNLLALDVDAQRLTRIAENLQRLTLSAQLQTGDASQRDWWDGQQFDRILADVPCTASGIVRRHPDIRWLRRAEDSAQLATLSARILDNLWMMTKPDGKLLLVTCSIWPDESEAQAAAFARRNNAKRMSAPGQLLPGSDAHSDHDGLFYALFQKV